MNQIFKITVGQDTIDGILPNIRVGKEYWMLFHIAGVTPQEGVAAPTVWITVGEVPYCWHGTWNSDLGVYVVNVNTTPTQTVGNKHYAITVGGSDGATYMVGQGNLTVYEHIAVGGHDTESIIFQRLDDLEGRVDALEQTVPSCVTKSQLSTIAEAIQSMPTDTPNQREARMVALLNALFGL